MALEFVSKKHDAHEDKEVEFALDKVLFTCRLKGDADSVLAWSEMAAAATEDDLDSPAGAAFSARFFKLMMPGGEYQRFRAHLKANHTHPDTLADVMMAVNGEMEGMVEQATARPTEQPQSSSDTQGDVAERRLQIISLSAAGGDIEYADEVPTGPPADIPAAARRPQDRLPKAKGQRRRAG